MECFESSTKRRVRATFPFVASFLGMPPTRPLVLAAASPALVRSRKRLALKFGQCFHQVKDQLATGRGRVDLLGEADKINSSIFEEVERLDEIFE